ncbi:oxidoreductase-like protein [Trypanosoma conorhini]|uniref:Oxidoreductase-like protein n=1 Tax=Trypanosoma conorhini TaxID=83891 RepID=A0A3R7NQL1_9TRYP|nr:oxidoreductase-like protein [Trypanosoma conorhini]RNF10064.1 oxidoreductase-like protein [Trypanosoma conorhini]
MAFAGATTAQLEPPENGKGSEKVEDPMSRSVDSAEDGSPSNDQAEETSMSLEEREARWGFTLDELHVATKVVRTLFHNPSLFVGDAYLHESRLYTMITRDRKTKRENREVYKMIMNEEKSRRKRFKRMQDIEAIRRTEMKREREEALTALMQRPTKPLLMIAGPAASQLPVEPPESAQEDAFDEAPSAANDPNPCTATDRQIIMLIGAFENVIRLEEAYDANPTAPEWLKISQLVAQVYRYLPHAFGSQMPPALLRGAVPAGTPPEQREKYTAFVKLRIAELCDELFTLGETDENDGNEENSTDAGGSNAGKGNVFPPSEDVLVAESALLRSVPRLRQCGDFKYVPDELRSALQHVVPTTDVLHSLKLVLAEGAVDNRFVPRDAKVAPTLSAEASLNLFIARRLYARRRVREWGESPFTVRTRPPISEDEEPDSYCVFDDVQVYNAGRSFPSDEALQLNRWIGCHTCRVRYNKLHPYYYSLCHLCGEYNFNKRLLTRDLRGKVVLLTGCRIKIGFAMALSLLRCGAQLVGTTRFVHEALARFQREPDYAEWGDRLHLFALDLRDLWLVTQFCAFLRQRFPKIFAVINNAAQTIARTKEYTAKVRHFEAFPPQELHRRLCEDATSGEWHHFFLTHTSVTIGEPLRIEHHPHEQPFLDDAANKTNGNHASPDEEQAGREASWSLAATATAASAHALAFDRYDTQAEESDTREANSWVMRLGEVPGSEAAELMAINALSPLIINSKLKPCLLNREGDAVPNEERFIINVSAMEGQFYRFKQVTHPHTNMAKAALNMMTRTSGEDYAQEGIFMNSVDTGWITDESPKAKKERRAEQSLLCPLDEIDAAARCLDLIYTNSREYGKFFKDFKEIPW